MKRLFAYLIIIATLLLGACNQAKAPNKNPEKAAVNTWTYSVDGVETSLEQLKQLSAQQLFYIVPQDTLKVAQIVTSQKAFDDLKAQHTQRRQTGLGTQGLFPCIAIKTKTRIFDLDNYGGAIKKLESNYYSLDLSNVSQSNPTPTTDSSPDWNNDINSVKGRDCRASYLMTDVNFGGSMLLVQAGQHIDHLPYPFHNSVSSISID